MAEVKEQFRSFTVRVPMSLYIEMSNQASKDKMHLNGKANELLRLGLGERINLNKALNDLIRERIGSITETE